MKGVIRILLGIFFQTKISDETANYLTLLRFHTDRISMCKYVDQASFAYSLSLWTNKVCQRLSPFILSSFSLYRHHSLTNKSNRLKAQATYRLPFLLQLLI
jgi:hypothetical protein